MLQQVRNYMGSTMNQTHLNYLAATNIQKIKEKNIGRVYCNKVGSWIDIFMCLVLQTNGCHPAA